MAQQVPNPLSTTLFEAPHRRLHILVIILVFLIVVFFIISYQVVKVEISKQDIPIQTKEQKLKEVSQNLTTQPQTKEFKAKLEAVSKSLNKK